MLARRLILLSGGRPRIVLSGASLEAGAAAGTDVGVFSVRNGKGSYTITLTDTASDAFALNVDGVTLEAGATPTTAGAYTITAQAVGATTFSQNFTITATAAGAISPFGLLFLMMKAA